MSWLIVAADITDVFRYVNTAGVVGLLALIVFGGYRKWWVFGWQYKESQERTERIEAERDGWRDIALHGTNLAEQTVDLFRKQQR